MALDRFANTGGIFKSEWMKVEINYQESISVTGDSKTL